VTYLRNLAEAEYEQLTVELLGAQRGHCYICEDEIDRQLYDTDIDHIIPLQQKGKDSKNNFAVVHQHCNRSKQDSNLAVARVLARLDKIRKEVKEADHTAQASLSHVLKHYGGSECDFRYEIKNGTLRYSFPQSDPANREAVIFVDKLSNEKTSFIEVPIEYLFHDEIINPRGINTSIQKLVKEFYKKNPQLHLSLARIDAEKIKIFDGQHKAVAQILLGAKKLALRLFLDPDVKRLTETNKNAGSNLRQIAFGKSVLRQLDNTLFYEKVREYQQAHDLDEDDFSFSEVQLIEYFKGDSANIKKYIIGSIKDSVTNSPDNKLRNFIDFEGRAKVNPISYSAFDKTILSLFIDSKKFLDVPISDALRELEREQMVKLLNIIAETIYIGKFDPDLGANRIEQAVARGSSRITDEHLVAFRMGKEEILRNWILFVQTVIKSYFSTTMGRPIGDKSLFREKFDEQLWRNIGNFIKNLSEIALWKNRPMAQSVFAGKQNFDYWEKIFATGRTPDGNQVIMEPLNYNHMILGSENSGS